MVDFMRCTACRALGSITRLRRKPFEHAPPPRTIQASRRVPEFPDRSIKLVLACAAVLPPARIRLSTTCAPNDQGRFHFATGSGSAFMPCCKNTRHLTSWLHRSCNADTENTRPRTHFACTNTILGSVSSQPMKSATSAMPSSQTRLGKRSKGLCVFPARIPESKRRNKLPLGQAANRPADSPFSDVMESNATTGVIASNTRSTSSAFPSARCNCPFVALLSSSSFVSK